MLVRMRMESAMSMQKIRSQEKEEEALVRKSHRAFQEAQARGVVLRQCAVFFSLWVRC